MHCIEESICDIFGTFRRPPVIRRPWHGAPLSPSLRPWPQTRPSDQCDGAHLGFKQTFLSDDLLEYVLSCVGVHSWERVVKQVNIGVGENCARERDALFLASAEVDALQKNGLKHCRFHLFSRRVCRRRKCWYFCLEKMKWIID